LNQQGESVRKLFRSRKERVIGGVCGGVAEYFNIDPVWVRIAWVLAIFVKGLGLVAYALCWILIPEREWSPADASSAPSAGPADKPEGEGAAGQAPDAEGKSSFLGISDSQPRTVIGIVLIILGCIFGAIAFVPFLNEHAFWALVLIVLGIVLIARR
jgi:phage shock protein PspC (stress-responsive transcriptional regulator)